MLPLKPFRLTNIAMGMSRTAPVQRPLDRFATPAPVIWVTKMYEENDASLPEPPVRWMFVPLWRSGYGLLRR